MARQCLPTSLGYVVAVVLDGIEQVCARPNS